MFYNLQTSCLLFDHFGLLIKVTSKAKTEVVMFVGLIELDYLEQLYLLLYYFAKKKAKFCSTYRLHSEILGDNKSKSL